MGINIFTYHYKKIIEKSAVGLKVGSMHLNEHQMYIPILHLGSRWDFENIYLGQTYKIKKNVLKIY